MRTRYVAALTALLLSSASVQAQPVRVDYTVTGSANHWLFNFTLVNNMVGEPADMGVYFFGVKLNGTAVVSTPAGWSSGSSWSYTPSDVVYDNFWSKNNFVGVMPGQSLSGFAAASYTLTAPTSIDWFAYAVSNSGQEYRGEGSFIPTTSNPGFEGQGSDLNWSDNAPDELTPVTTTPEPSTYVLLATGLAALVAASSRRRATQIV